MDKTESEMKQPSGCAAASFPPNITDIELAYGAEVALIALAIENYEKTGDQAFVFQAYAAWRKSQLMFPGYRTALLTRTGGTRLSDDTGQGWGDKVLRIMDMVAKDLCEPTGRAASQVRSAEIVETVSRNLWIAEHFHDRWRRGEDFKRGKPPATQSHLFKIAARAHGVSVSAVQKIWEEYLADEGLGGAYVQAMRRLKSPRIMLKAGSPKRPTRHPWKSAV